MLSPVIEQLSLEYGNDVKVVKVNVDQNQDLALSFQVMSIPTVILFKNGTMQDQMVGFAGKDYLKNKINQYL